MKTLSQGQIIAILCDPAQAVGWEMNVWQSAILVLREEKLLASVYHLAVEAGVYQQYPKFAQRHLYSANIYADRQAKQIEYEALLLNKLLAPHDITPVFLKGANYTLRQSKNSLGRICSDIDVLVEKSQINQCETLLLNQNWQSESLTDYDEKYYRQWAHEIPPLIHPFRGTVLDVHHNLYLPISGRSPDIKLFLSELSTTANGSSVLLPPQTVMHSIIHLFMNEDFSSGLRDLFDIYLLLQQYGDEQCWSELISVAEKTGFVVELHYCLNALASIFSYKCPTLAEQYFAEVKLTFMHKFWSHTIFINAILSQHPLVSTRKHKIAAAVAYFRGHWVKMPKWVLCKHFVVKTYKQFLDQVLGKHQLDAKQP